MVSSGRHSIKRVTPSSKLTAMLWPIVLLDSAASGSEVVDVDHMVDVVVLQDHLLALDQRLRSRGVERVEGGAEIGVHRLIAVAEGHPVEAQLADTAALREDLDIADVVRCPGLRHAGRTRPLGPDAEDSVFQAALVPVPDQ